MFILAGFTSPAANAKPHILYIGDDGELCDRIAEESTFPRVARLRNPQWQAIRHWSEEAAEAFEKQNNKNEAAASVQTESANPAGAAAAPAEPAPVEPPPASAPEPADAAEDEEPPLLPGQAKRRK
jgi:hypothetical protein